MKAGRIRRDRRLLVSVSIARYSNPMIIETAHLKLSPFSPGHLLALLRGRQDFEESFGLPLADGLRELYVSDEVSPAWVAALSAASAADPWVHGFAAIERDSASVVGSLGFKGPPSEAGDVEIAYGIAPGFQRRGYATEAAAAGVDFASSQGARQILAHTRIGAAASSRVLEKCGFALLGEVVDPEDGPVWRWRRAASGAEP